MFFFKYKPKFIIIMIIILLTYFNFVAIINNPNFSLEDKLISKYTNGENISELDRIKTKLMFTDNLDTVQSNDYKILFSSYFGGSSEEQINFTKIDKEGNMYFSGITTSFDFPLKNPVQDIIKGDSDIFLSKISSSGELLFSTYFGGSNFFEEQLQNMLIDKFGNIYIIGSTASDDLPTMNAIFDSLQGSFDVFIAKFSPLGSLIYNTYLGGRNIETIDASYLDEFGNIYITGGTGSNNFPTLNAFSEIGNLDSNFFVKLDSNGTLVFSTYFDIYISTSTMERRLKIMVDVYENVILFGSTSSPLFPLKKAYLEDYNLNFLSKFSSNGTLIFSTYLDTYIWSLPNILLDEIGNVYLGERYLTKLSSNGSLLFTYFVGGYSGTRLFLKNDNDDTLILIAQTSFSGDFILKDALDTSFNGGNDLYVSKFDTNGTLLFASYFGGSSDDYITSARLDSLGNIVLMGKTESDNFPILNGFDNDYSGKIDGFLLKIDSENQLVFSTYIGGYSEDIIKNMYIDRYNNIYLSGITFSPNFILKNSFDNTLDGLTDGFITKVHPNGSLLFSTFFGGSSEEIVYSVFADKQGVIYLNGITSSSDFPIQRLGEFNSIQGDSDGFIVILKYVIDNDLDAMDDDWELFYGLNISIDDSLYDKDKDGMTNLYEYQMGLNPIFNDALMDKDNDGMINIYEFQMGLKANLNDAMLDKDGDGMPNKYEFQMGFDPSSSFDADLDNDGDKLSNYLEYLLQTSPIEFDTDNDGIDDGYEYELGFDPLVFDSNFDSDSDFVSNLEEYKAGTDPLTILSFPIFSFNLVYLILVLVFLIVGIFAVLIRVSLRFVKYKNRIKAPSYYLAYSVWRSDFKDYRVYKKSKLMGANSIKEYRMIIKLKVPNFSIAKEVIKGNFKNYDQYIQAKSLNATTIDEYNLIQKYEAPDINTALNIEKGGFPSLKVYETALEKGYSTFIEFKDRKIDK